MNENEWLWLESLPFGVFVFSFPKKCCKQLPEIIAKGDLDGNGYFVCWDKLIIEHIVTDPINYKTPADEEVEKPQSRKSHTSSQLLGKLYSLSLQCADESDLFMRDPKAEAFADAYYAMLDSAKYWCKVKLKRELYEMIPPNLRSAVELIR